MSPFSPEVASDSLYVFLFSDIEGSTGRWERAPQSMRSILARHDAVMRVAMEGHGGHVFKTLGDGFCVAFPNAANAVAAAVAAQLALAAEDFSAADGVLVRMGVHAGTAERRDGDYFGPTLNRVARLMATAHGGQIVVSGAVAGSLNGGVPAAGQLLDLGQHRLKDLIQPEHVFQVMAPGLESDFPALRSLGSIPNNLPRQPNALVGRQAELDEVSALLEHHRLVTLVGSGGFGKTRLSLQVGAELLERYPDGVWFVELAPLNEDNLIAETVATVFNLPGSGNRSATDVLTGFLKHKKLLLILDNCEHLIASVAALAHAIISHCPDIWMLASSREPLQIAGEYAFRLPILAVPSDIAGISAAEAITYPAVELFVARARSALGIYILSDVDAPSVAAICRRLDGIAFAIELAAPRLKMLKPAQLLEKLDDRFRILTGGSRTASPRQQTLRALIDWSHNLLSVPEQVLMRRLSVFADGWTLDAAGAVASDESIEEWEVFDLLASLIDKSLVVADQSGQEARYRYLETTRHYAADKLAEAGEAHWLERLPIYFAGLMKQASIAWQTMSNASWRAIYAPELDNVRGALDHAFASDGNPATGLELMAYGSRLFHELNHFVEQERRVEIALPHLTVTTPSDIAARLYLAAGQVRAMSTISERDAADRAVAFARLTDDPLLLCRALTQFANSFLSKDGVAEALTLTEEALAILRPLGRTKLLVNALNSRGMIAGTAGDMVAAVGFFEEALVVARATGGAAAEAILLSNIAQCRAEGGDIEGAITGNRAAISVARAGADRGAEMHATGDLAVLLLIDNRPIEALSAAAVALEMALELGRGLKAALVIVCIADVILQRGDFSTAARLQGFVDAALAAQQYACEPLDQRIVTQVHAGLAAALPAAELDRLMADGAAMTLDEAVALALKAAR